MCPMPGMLTPLFSSGTLWWPRSSLMGVLCITSSSERHHCSHLESPIRGVPAGLTRSMISQLDALWRHGVGAKSWQGPRGMQELYYDTLCCVKGAPSFMLCWKLWGNSAAVALKCPCVRLTSPFKPFQNLTLCDVTGWRVHWDGQISSSPVGAVDHSTPSSQLEHAHVVTKGLIFKWLVNMTPGSEIGAHSNMRVFGLSLCRPV